MALANDHLRASTNQQKPTIGCMTQHEKGKSLIPPTRGKIDYLEYIKDADNYKHNKTFSLC